mgnify:CR=1 FL=1
MKWTPKMEDKLKKLCFEGKSNAEIAEALQIPINAVYAKRSQLGITIDKVKATRQQTTKPAFYESVKESLKDLQNTLWTALNSPKITAEEDRILSELVTLIQGAEGLFLQAIKED